MTKHHVLSLSSADPNLSTPQIQGEIIPGFLDRMANEYFAPYEAWERELHNHLRRQPAVPVIDIAILTKYPPQQCHLNVARYVSEHPDATHVLGWLEMDGSYTLHSMASRNGRVLNVTPTNKSLPFVVDPILKLQWVRGDTGNSRAIITREGRTMPHDVRSCELVQEYVTWAQKIGWDPVKRTVDLIPGLKIPLRTR